MLDITSDEDTWTFNVQGYGKELEDFRLISSKLVENGPLRKVVKIKAKFRNSYFEQDIILYEDCDFIEGRYRVF